MENLFDVPRLKHSKPAQKRIRTWIKALRSGKYKKGKGFLRFQAVSGESVWCCLGVMIDVAHPKIWKWRPSANKSGAVRTRHDEAEMPSVKHQVEFCLGGNEFLDTTSAAKLAHMNDEGKSFKVIADRLERHLKAALR